MKNIAITIGLNSNNETLWNNGIKLNALYLAKLLRNSNKYNVFLVNVTKEDITEYSWDTNIFPTYHINERKDDIDVLISLGGQITPEMSKYLKSKGTKLISYKCGDEYTWRLEHIVFNQDYKTTKIWANPDYDEIWTVPQIYEQNKYYFQRLHKNKKVRTIPFIWDSIFLDQVNKQLNNKCYYTNTDTISKNIAIMEPNVNVSKYMMYPLLIVDDVYETNPEYIKHVYVNNTDKIKTNNLFIDIMSHLSVVKDGKASFESRYNTAEFIANYADIIVSHQWTLPLNYFYFDVAYFGHAILHNAHMCKDIGYYYDGFNGEYGKEKLLWILEKHDKNLDEYTEKNREKLFKYSTDNERNIEGYVKLINKIK
jgi:hypothetical protein